VIESATIVSERTLRVGKDSCGRCVLAVLAITRYKSNDSR
jgi:hypothetical protein